MSSKNNTMNQNNKTMADEPQKSSAISNIYKAFKDVHEASRATSQVEKELKSLQVEIKEDTEVLEHRRRVEANYNKIIAEQTAIVEEGLSSEGKIDDLTKQNAQLRSELENDLEKMIERHASTLSPLKTNNENAQKALDEAAKELAIYKRQEQNSRQQLENLIIQRNKQTKSLSVAIAASQDIIIKLRHQANDPDSPLSDREALDLREKITIEQKKLGENQAQLHKIERSIQEQIEKIEDSLAEESILLEQTKAEHDRIKSDAEAKRKRLEEQNENCRLQEVELQEKIDGIVAYQKSLDEHYSEIEEAIEEARALIEEAHDIHNTPETTRKLALSIMKKEAQEEDLELRHQQLQAYEDDLRSKTRTSRVVTITTILVLILVIVLLVIAFNLGWFA